MLHFVILDDDHTHNINTSKRLELIFKQYAYKAAVALSTTEPDEVIAYCLENNTRNNVYLLDVKVQRGITGIDVAGMIREKEIKAYIVFVSAHPEYILPSLKTRVFDYLIKPVSVDTLMTCIHAIQKDFTKINTQMGHIVSIKSGFNLYTLALDEITYVEKYGHLLVVHTVSGRVESSESLDSIEKRLDPMKFFRCHKSYIVNVLHIARIDYSNSTIYLKNGEMCTVSKRCKKELKTICTIV